MLISPPPAMKRKKIPISQVCEDTNLLRSKAK